MIEKPFPRLYNVDTALIEETQLTGYCGDRKCFVFPIIGKRGGENVFSSTVYNDLVSFDLDEGHSIYPTIKDEIYVKSTNKNDKCKLEIIYLDENWNMKDIHIQLEGINKIFFTDAKNKKIKINRIIWAHLVGGKTPNGNIEIAFEKNKKEYIIENIIAGNNRSFSGRFTVPDECFAFLINWIPNVIIGEHVIKIISNTSLFERELLEEYCWIDQLEWSNNNYGNYELCGDYLRFPPRSDIKIQTLSSKSSGSITGTIKLFLIEKQQTPMK